MEKLVALLYDISTKISDQVMKALRNLHNIQKNNDWEYISSTLGLNEAFIREFKDNVDWTRILLYQKLSEDVIKEFKEFKERVDWDYITWHQNLSGCFITEFWKL